MDNRPNFNDYVQNVALGAIAGLQYASIRQAAAAAAAEANERDMRYWRDVVRYRYPDINDRIDIEDAAERLMGFDVMETEAQHKRDLRLHYPQQVSFLSRIPGLLAIFFVTLVVLFWRVIGEEDGDTIAESWNMSQPWGWTIVAVAFGLSVWHIAAIATPAAPSYHPQDDSLICQIAYPGRRLTTKGGTMFRVSSEATPNYYPKRLKFDVPAEGSGLRYSSEDILWDADTKQTMNRSLDH